MRRFTLLMLVALLGGTVRLAAQETVETRSVTSVIKIDEVIFGHLTELNGRFKFAPPNSPLPQTATSESITTLGPEFDM
jgi:hypothetical protein